MVVSHEVKQTVNDQFSHFPLRAAAVKLRLTEGDFRRNDDFTHEGHVIHGLIAIGKAEHVGRGVTIPISVVQYPHLGFPDENDRQYPAPDCQRLESGITEECDGVTVNLMSPLSVPDLYSGQQFP